MDELKKALLAEPLSRAEAHALMRRIMAGDLTPVQTAGVLMALRTRGETPEEIAGFAAGMREAAVRVETRRQPLLDIVGTGGVAPEAFNISTTTCFVVAAGGVAVAKHGNRAASSKSGSFDLIEALGIRIDIPAEKVAEAIETVGLGFLFARNHHPAMRYVAPVRAELGVRTVFNLLGPLTNPAFASLNLVGVSSPALVEPFAQVLRDLGSSRALVVHGQMARGEGLEAIDELALGDNLVAELRDGQIRTYRLQPEEVGLEPAPYAAIGGGTAAENAAEARAILSGQQRGPKRDAVALNAGAAFYLAGRVEGVAEGVRLAQQLLDEGAGLAVLERLVHFTQA
ncbi:anthranilate phosphoribosyltransferase [Meiothermus ruber]|uniref:Anthranilate phosphoribosyltransferase n=1 Tax=Meiothermus ruber (strain ATCC 35948 / DSM 1279 / VKM B-1258 / 21) TaxID=504728 RepID=D3PPR4_MEIRD|nr:anthranilate phosphoribosyltransferase [Meiothermus ruber]ADD29678.1 anthranilate phosphoribosyltransferase [Meiothermus ruber DSM 1279]AGK04867.1 anthranilate phosphoribosyltransferase [Meiothermus ruber DSM 1279]MCL6530569.1 anthranilate phosphoribosyltransferase [Meiothermus ruber]GAO76595.1 anthranilate phosphoribosyltransferase [Meiothermus ruber H328]